MSVCYASMVLMMILLLVLQIFWTYYIIQSFLSVNVTNKVRHNYDWNSIVYFKIHILVIIFLNRSINIVDTEIDGDTNEQIDTNKD